MTTFHTAIQNVTSVPRPILRLAALILAGVAIIIIANTGRDLWQSSTTSAIELPPGLAERQSTTAPAIDPPQASQIYCYNDGQPIYDELACMVPTATPATINSSLQIEPTPSASGFRTGSGLSSTSKSNIDLQMRKQGSNGYTTSTGLRRSADLKPCEPVPTPPCINYIPHEPTQKPQTMQEKFGTGFVLACMAFVCTLLISAIIRMSRGLP